MFGYLAILKLVHFCGEVIAGRVVAGHQNGDAFLCDQLCEEFEIWRPVSLSRSLVGSSAISIAGPCARARAIERRCCWPPDISKGR